MWSTCTTLPRRRLRGVARHARAILAPRSEEVLGVREVAAGSGLRATADTRPLLSSTYCKHHLLWAASGQDLHTFEREGDRVRRFRVCTEARGFRQGPRTISDVEFRREYRESPYCWAGPLTGAGIASVLYEAVFKVRKPSIL